MEIAGVDARAAICWATALSELGPAGSGVDVAFCEGGATDEGGGVFETRSASSFSDGRGRWLFGPDASRCDMGAWEAGPTDGGAADGLFF